MGVDERDVDRWLGRGTRFFRAITRNATIRAELNARGLHSEELTQGWRLYSALVGLERTAAKPALSPNDAARAMNELDAWDAPNFAAARAVLAQRTPNAVKFLFARLKPSKGPEAVVAVDTFLQRWEQLRSGTASDVGQEEASRAIEILAQRRIIDAENAAQLRALVTTAQRGEPERQSAQQEGGIDEAAFEAFQGWLHEWRELARTTFKRRDYLIALGLATRRTNNQGRDEVVDDSDDPEA